MAFGIALVLLAAFVANVTIGATTGTPVVGTVVEMLILFLAAIAFVVAILQREAAAKAARPDRTE